MISPLLANIVLNHLDWRLDQEGFKFIRYADDFVILCRSKEDAEKALACARCVIQDELDETEIPPRRGLRPGHWT